MSGIILKMVFGIASQQIKNYSVETPLFSGPLDLLLSLIERAELDITTFSLAAVTDQYVTHLNAIRDQLSEEVSAFIVIAAKLIQIKSEALLPHVKDNLQEENLGDELAKQLLEYQRYKRVSIALAKVEESGWRTYIRLAVTPKTDQLTSFEGIDLSLLRILANSILNMPNEITKIDQYLAIPKITIREKIHQIVTTLGSCDSILYTQLLSPKPQVIEVVVTFLAMLELIKQKWIEVSQSHNFSNIFIKKTVAFNSESLFALEFEE